MGSAAAEVGVAEGYEALASGDWTAARAAFEAALSVYWCLTNVAGLMRQLTEEPVTVATAGGGS